MRRLDRPDGYICLGSSFCWPVHGWRPNALQRWSLRVFLGIMWKDGEK